MPPHASYSKPELEDNPASRLSYPPVKSELSATMEKAPLSELAGNNSMIHELPGSTHELYEAESSPQDGRPSDPAGEPSST